MLCSKCKNEIADGVKYCPRCGNQLRTGISFSKKQIFAGIAAILVGIGCFSMFTGNSSTETKKRISVTAEARIASDDLYKKGKDLLDKGNFQEAAIYFSDAINKNPYNADAFFARYLCHTQLKNFNEAFADINMAIELKPNETRLYMFRGSHLYYQQDYDSAVKDLTRVITAGKGDFNVYVLRGASYLHLNKPHEALSDFAQAAQHTNDKTNNIDKSQLHKYIGDARYQERDFKKAIESYNKAISINKDNELAKENRIIAFRKAIASVGDLSVLKVMSHNEIKPLVNLLEKKISVNLRNTPNYDPNDYKKLHKEVAKELSLLAGNTIANFGRGGKGVSYDEMLLDAGKCLGVDLSKCKTNVDRELVLLRAYEKNGEFYPDYLVNYSQLAKAFNIVEKFQGKDVGMAIVGAVLEGAKPDYDTTIPAILYIAAKRRNIMKCPIVID